MLSNSVSDQMKAWTVRTDSQGNGSCQSLILVEFTLRGDAAQAQAHSSLSSVYRISVHAEGMVLSDPVAYVTKRH